MHELGRRLMYGVLGDGGVLYGTRHPDRREMIVRLDLPR